jgi:hypothetical protein
VVISLVILLHPSFLGGQFVFEKISTLLFCFLHFGSSRFFFNFYLVVEQVDDDDDDSEKKKSIKMRF